MHERLRELRLALGLTQKAFGEKIGLQNSSIATYESGRNKPSGAAIKQICDRFRVNERWLRTGEGEMFVPGQGISSLFQRKNCSQYVCCPIPGPHIEE